MKHWALLSILISGSAFAAGPQFSTTCDVARNIRVPSTSGGFYMSSDCKTAFILPPSKGLQIITARTVGNLDRCQEVKGLNTALREINKQLNAGIKGKIDDAGLTTILEKRKKILTEYSDLENTLGASVGLIFDMAVDKT